MHKIPGTFWCRGFLYPSGEDRKVIQERYVGGFVVNAAAVMHQSVGNNDVRRPMNVVVATNLVEYRLGQWDMWRFALNQQKRLALSVKDQNIGSLLGLVQHQSALGAN